MGMGISNSDIFLPQCLFPGDSLTVVELLNNMLSFPLQMDASPLDDFQAYLMDSKNRKKNTGSDLDEVEAINE
jgi:hypothetical protein